MFYYFLRDDVTVCQCDLQDIYSRRQGGYIDAYFFGFANAGYRYGFACDVEQLHGFRPFACYPHKVGRRVGVNDDGLRFNSFRSCGSAFADGNVSLLDDFVAAVTVRRHQPDRISSCGIIGYFRMLLRG